MEAQRSIILKECREDPMNIAHIYYSKKPGRKRILVLATTNRPLDLDESIIRRFQKRIMVGTSYTENKKKILKTLLANEKVDKELDFRKLSTMVEGYIGSDLKADKIKSLERQDKN
ncbi:Spastin, partial [Mucuna pruriens]